jgi:hypothetical protein
VSGDVPHLPTHTFPLCSVRPENTSSREAMSGGRNKNKRQLSATPKGIAERGGNRHNQRFGRPTDTTQWLRIMPRPAQTALRRKNQPPRSAHLHSTPVSRSSIRSVVPWLAGRPARRHRGRDGKDGGAPTYMYITRAISDRTVSVCVEVR